MRILIVSALFPPHVIGGAEMCAYNFAIWAARNGQTIGVYTASNGSDAVEEAAEGPLTMWRAKTPHLYPVAAFQKQPRWKKPLWHLQDHVDRRGQAAFGRALDAFLPDLVLVHGIQGLGYPLFAEMAARDLPVGIVLHDLGLACIRMNMFKGGSDCAAQCAACRLSAGHKRGLMGGLRRLAFLSPSRFNLDEVGKYVDMRGRPTAAILNANPSPQPDRAPIRSEVPQLLYVGRLHASKGVADLLAAAADLARTHRFTLTLLGDGEQAAELRAGYAHHDWCRFAGRVSETEVANRMTDSDMLCVPSIWHENSPGVVIQALGLGLPVIASDRGGLPELVRHEANGLIFKGGDRGALKAALLRVLEDRALVAGLAKTAVREKARFDQDAIGRRTLTFLQDFVECAPGEA